MYTLFKKEIWRFWKVSFQTVAAPVMTALLYLLIFSHALATRLEVYPGVSYTAFLIPGLVMMSLLQNSFANSSSSLIQSKVMGNIVFLLLTPISYLEFFLAFLAASMVRGIAVGLCVYLVTRFWVDLPFEHPWYILGFALMGSAMMGAMGIVAGIWTEKFDQLAAFQNFIIMPLTFLSGVFYSIHSLPPLWHQVSRFTPFFYIIDGFRYGFFGQGDVSPALSLSIVSLSFVVISVGTLQLLKSGYKLRG
jgi:ABC-2 type transport system permease protein